MKMKMKIVFAAAVMSAFLFCAAPLAAQAPAGWGSNLETAIKNAGKMKKPVLALFSGTDWCPACKQLRANVLDKNEFKKFAAKNLVLVYLHVPYSISGNESGASQARYSLNLAGKYKVEGYPCAVILNSKGREVKRIEGYTRDWLNSVKKAVTAAQK